VPSWFVDIPTALAVSQEVVRQGPYGERQALTSPRSAHEALPRDTIRLTPLIVDEAGLVPPERVDVAWFLCETADCVLSLAVEAPAACPPTPAYDTVTFCELGRGSSVEFELGEPEVGDAIVLADLLTAPSVLLVGSATPGCPWRRASSGCPGERRSTSASSSAAACTWAPPSPSSKPPATPASSSRATAGRVSCSAWSATTTRSWSGSRSRSTDARS